MYRDACGLIAEFRAKHEASQEAAGLAGAASAARGREVRRLTEENEKLRAALKFASDGMESFAELLTHHVGEPSGLAASIVETVRKNRKELLDGK